MHHSVQLVDAAVIIDPDAAVIIDPDAAVIIDCNYGANNKSTCRETRRSEKYLSHYIRPAVLFLPEKEE